MAASEEHPHAPYSEQDVRVALDRVRAHCLTLPETSERLSHGAPTFFIREKKTFVMFHDDHHGDGMLALWCAAPEGVQLSMVEEDPLRFYTPAYVGRRGWIGVRLDVEVDWDEVGSVIKDAFRCVAPAALVAQLDAGVDN